MQIVKFQNNTSDTISRKEALKKVGNYSKYAAISAIGIYLILQPKKLQALSPGKPVGF